MVPLPSERHRDASPSTSTSSAPREPQPQVPAFREVDLERLLFRWFERRPPPERPPPKALRRKALHLARRLGATRNARAVITPDWVHRWQVRYGVADAALDGDESERPKTSDGDAEPDASADEPAKADGTDQQYALIAFPLDWTSLPDATLERPPRGAASTGAGAAWVLGAASRSGGHRTRLLVAGRWWRPRCLAHVDMRSQPVVYAGGGCGEPTQELFRWWFHQEFAPAALAVNPQGATLVAYKASFLPDPQDCVSGRVRLSIAESSSELDVELVEAELRARYASLLLSEISLAGRTSPSDFLSKFCLRDAFPLLHRAWLSVRSESYHRCWSPPPASSPSPLLCLTSRASGEHAQADRMLLLELQWQAHDLGLEVTDSDLAKWARPAPTTHAVPAIKTEREEADSETEDEDDADAEVIPSASEAAEHLTAALRWMETQPMEPAVLLVIRDLAHAAQQARLAQGHEAQPRSPLSRVQGRRNNIRVFSAVSVT